jgi:hypothetical protein
MPEALVDHDFNWHDGVLVDLQLAGFGGERPEIRLVVDLYPDTVPQTQRRRYVCVGENLSRFLVKGDIPKLIDNAASGNIDWMRIDFAETTQVVVLLLFGGYIEAEATTFTLAELNS